MDFIKNWWSAFHASFRDSSVIVFARIQVAFGIVWAVLVATDISPLFSDPKYVTAWLLFSGVVTELLRRNNATDLGPDEPRDTAVKEPL